MRAGSPPRAIRSGLLWMNGRLTPSVGLMHQRALDATVIAAAAVLSSLVGFWIGSRPVLAVLPIAGLIGLLLLVDGRARAVFLIGGGLMTLQSSQELDLLKLAYLVGVGVSFGGALLQLRQPRHVQAYQFAMPLLRASVVFTGLVFLSFFVAHLNDATMTAWLRGAAPYLLFASVPVFAVDVESSFSSRAMKAVLVIGGVVAASSFTVEWLERRNIAELPISRLAFPSFLLAAALFAYGLSASLRASTQRLIWVLLASFVFTSLLMTGTRTTLVLLAAPLGIALAGWRYLGIGWLRLAVLGPAAVAVAFFVFQSAGNFVDADTEAVGARLQLLRGDISSDQSYLERVTQSEVVWSFFREHPALGVGPGQEFEWRDTSGSLHVTLSPDTPLSFLAKFGLLGLGALVSVVVGYASFFASLGRTARASLAHLALSGFAAIVLIFTVLVSPFEDKGFSLALVILVALALREMRDRASTQAAARGRIENGP
jgi:O-antigen ligase